MNYMSRYEKALLAPDCLYSKVDIEPKNGLLPREAGIYAWYFGQVPSSVQTDKCKVWNGHTLLYVGITRDSLRRRIWSDHLTGNAYGSTLRLSLGCLLSKELRLRLEGQAGSKRRTFGKRGEERLSNWLEQHGKVVWARHSNPESLKKKLIGKISVPLALKHNRTHPFYWELKRIRKKAKMNAVIRP